MAMVPGQSDAKAMLDQMNADPMGMMMQEDQAGGGEIIDVTPGDEGFAHVTVRVSADQMANYQVGQQVSLESLDAAIPENGPEQMPSL